MPLTLRIPPDLLDAVEKLARADDVTVGQFVRQALTKELSRRHTTRAPARAGERLITPIKARLTPAFANASNWGDLASRLASQGFELRQAGGGLAVHRHPSGQRVCKASELGYSYTRLLRRFRAPFPGHTHTWLFERVNNQSTTMRLVEPG